MKKWIFNPFVYVAGSRALTTGLAAMIIIAVVAYYSHSLFDGVLDVHVRVTSLSVYSIAAFIDWGCTVLVFYIAGLIFSRSSFRFIDIAGTFALARWVLIFSALACFAIRPAADIRNMTASQIASLITPAMIIAGIFQLLVSVWSVALMYNAFSVSANVRGSKAAGIFTAGIIVAEVLSKVIFHFLITA